MPRSLIQRLNHTLERRLPEQRLFLKTDSETRFIRFRPLTQAAIIGTGVLLTAWMLVATAILMIDHLSSAGSARDQVQRSITEFERRLDVLSRERDERATEAANAQDRFNQALTKVSDMQSLLLRSEERRKEIESGLDGMQRTLSRVIRERDEARTEVARLKGELVAAGGEGSPELERARDDAATLGLMAAALNASAQERDIVLEASRDAQARAKALADDKRKMERRNDEIFRKLEEAVSVSMEPLDRMFRAAGLRSEDVLRQVRRGYSGQGGPLGIEGFPRTGSATSQDEMRAGAILEGFDRMALYRLAAAKIPFANPVRGSYRFTSPFGYRRDPMGRGNRMHAGTDFAGARGTPIVATGNGTVKKAGYQNGYGNVVVIEHAFGIETVYAHMSQIAVRQGQTVSRGDRIGGMGNTGRSTGTHLHYEVRVDGKPVNPMTYIKAASNVF